MQTHETVSVHAYPRATGDSVLCVGFWTLNEVVGTPMMNFKEPQQNSPQGAAAGSHEKIYFQA